MLLIYNCAKFCKKIIEEGVCEHGREIEEGDVTAEMKTKVDIETSEFDVCLQKVKQEYPKSNGALLDTDTDAWKPECYALNDAIQIENNPFVTSYGCIFKGTMIWKYVTKRYITC